jgi:hypothetical protein
VGGPFLAGLLGDFVSFFAPGRSGRVVTAPALRAGVDRFDPKLVFATPGNPNRSVRAKRFSVVGLTFELLWVAGVARGDVRAEI